MSEQTPAVVPAPVVIPPKPRPTRALEREADSAIRYLEMFTSNRRLDADLRMSLGDIKNTVKMLKASVVRMSEEAESNHDRLVEVVKSQRLIG